MLKEGSHKGIDIPMRREHSEQRDEEGSGAKWWIIILLVALIAGSVIFAIPAYKGYKAYSAMTDSGVPETYVEDMKGLAAENARLALLVNETQSALEQSKKDYGVCVQEKNAKEELVVSLGVDLQARKTELDSCTTQVETDASAIANAARRICCIQRVENPAISGYTVLDSKISCVTEGGESISC